MSLNVKESSGLISPLCLSHERIALLQFKDSFTISEDASGYPSSYPKVESWNNSSDCCSWNGVECDDDTGHVIALDLTSSCLYGTINSNSSLFRLSHLRSLSLADNDFNHSQIPSRLANLSRLVHLDLSFSTFEGQIPSEFSRLSGLVYLNLSLAYVNSTVPRFLTNLSSLVALDLQFCSLYGEFPSSIFRLPNLEYLHLTRNDNLSGSLPDFNFGSRRLKSLSLGYTGFSGAIPSSIGNLYSLKNLQLQACGFTGLLPSSLSKLKMLTYLDLSDNNFRGPVPSLQNLTHLTALWLCADNLSGQIPAWVGNLTQLTILCLRDNNLQGPVPTSLSRLTNLQLLALGHNELSGTLAIDMFLGLKYLSELQLSGNKLSVLTETGNANATVSKFEALHLGSCNLSTFPVFLRYQDKIRIIDLWGNQIYGNIPKWLFNTSVESLVKLKLSDNLLTGFDQSPPVILPWARLSLLDLSKNMLKGSIPISQPSIYQYDVSNNKLRGEISPLFCNMSYPKSVDLSKNKLIGMLPKCLEKLSNSLKVLNLGSNDFHGTIPRIGTNGSDLVAVDLSNNQLEGPLPRSLANCTKLEILNLGNNKLNDGFPSWLGTLSVLRLILLRQNHLNGVIKNPISKFEFPKLRVIDLSYNNFSGLLPSQYFKQWNAMNHVNVSNSSYLYEKFVSYTDDLTYFGFYNYSMTIANRGIDLAYGRIQEVFVAMDFSSNRFEGEIPDCIGSLQGLQVLNLSNNFLNGGIPSSLGNITRLESLDLSQNKLSGEIPRQLAQLTFLAFMNVSNNDLIGPIPQGKQLDTFDNTSYIGNSRLCGDPLSKMCGNFDQSPIAPSSSLEEQDSGSVFDSNWMTILFGYLGGLVVGIAIEHIVATQYGWSGTTFFLRKLRAIGWY
ncbi:Leucine-rich repeat domain containing protein [Trema orientale]|uniref:Leucine-rich repeat domain containing protein n=1 Tax=Trema orientale TaxID=63057 RepID=A0A2P5C1U2_TREOI|nr:Leucine-rich repeat domain containing protein [Trema orientale]